MNKAEKIAFLIEHQGYTKEWYESLKPQQLTAIYLKYLDIVEKKKRYAKICQNNVSATQVLNIQKEKLKKQALTIDQIAMELFNCTPRSLNRDQQKQVYAEFKLQA